LDYALYNHRANELLTDWLKSLDVKLLYQEVKSSFPSVDSTLQHMKNGQNFWHAVISNANINSLDEELRTDSVDWVIRELLTGSRNLIRLIATLSDDDLLTTVSSPTMTKTKYEFLLHAMCYRKCPEHRL
jgi:uncharacterized damage-inducible protein DinB